MNRTLQCRPATDGDECGGSRIRLSGRSCRGLMFSLQHHRRTPRRAAARRSERPPLRSERGVTLVEMLVASFILAVGIAGVATIFIASAESVAVVQGQADATDVATGEVEIIRSMPYGEVGISVAADGYEPVVAGRRTVTEAATNRVEPLGQVIRAGVDFRIDRSVTWEPIGGNPDGYKVVSITVRWDAPAGERSVAVQTGLFSDGDR